jgi:hypothetical protein
MNEQNKKFRKRGGVLSKTILLKQGEIKRLVKMKEIVEAVEMSYTEHARGRVQMPPKNYLFFKYGDLRIMPCFMESLDEAGVKCVNVHPENPKKHGLPSVMGIIELVDPETGFPIALDGWNLDNEHENWCSSRCCNQTSCKGRFQNPGNFGGWKSGLHPAHGS